MTVRNDSPATSYDITSIRVDRRALTIRAAQTILNQPLTPQVLAELVRTAAGEIVDTLPLRLLGDVYKHVIPSLMQPDADTLADAARYTPAIDVITIGDYHELLRETARNIPLPDAAVRILRTAYGDEVLDLPYAAAAQLLKQVFDRIEREGN